ncbi:hypothetical protein BJ986_000155 [Phycicoccus badiiscoriae]|uniref:DUF4440 domain-containing protein n=1 Tax=Pedococcus badiiscoriae TaxID=642776 RepID=A0A852W9B2_9MICO|nr:DUF4440 domain-containing protein [Pedococcus badiiscoriae]NYG05668.1 hypothetical protein [Pedococcus badiiscoriae]
MSPETDTAEIEALVRVFFEAFTSGPELPTRMARLRSILLPEAVVIRTCGLDPVVSTVEGFIAPREALLSGGTLVDFKEWSLSGRVDRFGDIAHWFGAYAKSGRQDGAAFTGQGMKSLQFIRTPDGWRISAAAWDDERDGLAILELPGVG